MTSGPITSWQKDGETMETVRDFIFLLSKSLQMVTAAMKLIDTCSSEEKLLPTYDSILKAETLLCNKGPCSQSYGFSSHSCMGVRVGP